MGAMGAGGFISAYLTYKSNNRKTDGEIIDNIIQRLTNEIERLDGIRKELEELVIKKDDDLSARNKTIRDLRSAKHELELLVSKLQSQLEEK